MKSTARVDLETIEQTVCGIAAQHLHLDRSEVQPDSRLIEDLNCDSLDFVELIMALEEELTPRLSASTNTPLEKSIFTRKPFRLCDLAEAIFVFQGSTGNAGSIRLREGTPEFDIPISELPFSQLGGRWRQETGIAESLTLWESLEDHHGQKQYRRRSDGMRCVQIPGGRFEMGCDRGESQPDERPLHPVELDPFLIDVEAVSTTAFCRFLNSIDASQANLRDWFVLDPADDRQEQLQIARTAAHWQPLPGTETAPMVLVSWYGANAYSLWANGADWRQYQTHAGFLPTEAQWEYAAQGASNQPMVYGQHEPGHCYEPHTLQMQSVHVPLGVSDWGVYHMAGNVWQWCQDWYAEDFYQQAASRGAIRSTFTQQVFAANEAAVGSAPMNCADLPTAAAEPLKPADAVWDSAV